MGGIFRVALTGGIGSGKSTVSSKFQSLGVPVIDSDIISRNIVKADEPCLTSIVNQFGINILDTGGNLDRHRLRDVIFNDSDAKMKLENILHPAIYKEIDEQVSYINYPYCLIVIPLLIETKATNRFDRTLIIDVPEDIQLRRAIERDNQSKENIMSIIKSQASREQRLKFADEIIDNNAKIKDLDQTIQNLHDKYLSLAKSKYNP